MTGREARIMTSPVARLGQWTAAHQESQEQETAELQEVQVRHKFKCHRFMGILSMVECLSLTFLVFVPPFVETDAFLSSKRGRGRRTTQQVGLQDSTGCKSTELRKFNTARITFTYTKSTVCVKGMLSIIEKEKEQKI